MPQPYPDLAVNNTVQLWQYANTVTDNWATIVTAMILVVVLTLVLRKSGSSTSEAFAVGSYLSLILSVLLWGAGLIAGNIVVFLFVMCILGTLWFFIDGR